VKRQIHERFDINLTLESCAERLNYHPVYLGRVFRKETGMSFSEYLSRYRISVAKKWLAETNMTVAEIAEKLGYHNGPNFSRSFKKFAGVSPGQYRERYHLKK